MNRETITQAPHRRYRSRITSLSAVLCAALVLDAPPAAVEQIAINDNRLPGGTLKNGVLTIRLEAREGEWHPDRDKDPGVVVLAFGEEGKKLQVPGPLIRVTEGTEVHAFVRNSIGDETLTVHGLYARGSPASDTVQVKPNETREVRFVAGMPGTYYYWAATTSDPQLARRVARNSQLSGAIVVEPRGAPPQHDRVLVISLWGDPAAGVPGQRGSGVTRIVMNGKSWPSTERLSYQTGDTVRLRLINAGAAVHPMHLHGFYFRVDSRGDERTDSVFATGATPRMAVTERLVPGRTFSLTWVPTRAGNWLFHCHDNVHIVRQKPLDGSAPAVPPHHVENHALEMMGGPVMGIHVTGRSTDGDGPALGDRRRLRLVARVDSASTDSEPAYGFALQEGNKTSPSARPSLPGPTIVLKRGQPVSLTVVNELPEATAVHWHGIELESYFDGVAGFAGAPGRIAPAIAPRDSFEARFTPPRSGTFIYHTHIDEVRQQQAGLSGALIVVDERSAYDPETDIVLLVTVPRLDAQGDVVLLNGSSTPAPREMRVGTSYRLRFINVHTYRPSMIMKVMRDSTVLRWRAIAKDGMELPADQATVRSSAQQMGNGETYDFEFTPAAPGDLKIEVTAGNGTLLVTMPVRVR